MRVAVLLDRFPMTSETFVTTGISGLLRAGCDVAVIARRTEPDEILHAEARALGLVEQVTYLDAELEPDQLRAAEAVPLAPGRHDVLHAHFGSNARHYLFARTQAAAPLVATFHGHDYTADPRRHGRRMYERLFATADAITCNSEEAHRALLALGCPAEKLYLARMPIDVSSFDFRERRRTAREPLRFVTVARLVEKKGHAIALRALARARDRLPEFRYDVVGDGPLAGELERLASSLGLRDLVCLHGAVDSRAVRQVLDEAHVFLLASTTAADGDEEGTPISLMEAQACGLPVVSTRHGGIPEVVVDGRSGLLVAEGDPEAFARALVDVARAPVSWLELGGAGRAHVEATFDVGICTESMLDAYRAAIERHAESRSPERALG